MSKKFIYNNNHVFARCIRTGKKRIVERDYSGHWGIVCDSCSKEIFVSAPYSVSISDTEIKRQINGKTSTTKLSNNIKEKSVEKLMAGNREQSDYCNTCVGKMEDFRQKIKAKANNQDKLGF